ncbi:MAG: branched-chain amino acid ABC transporter permease [Rubrobacter sp.]
MKRLLNPILLALVALLVLAILPVFVRSFFALSIFILIFFYTALTAAWNIPVFGGKLSLGHAAFFGLGAYTAAILYVDYGIIPWIGVFAATAVSLLGAVVLTPALVLLRGPFFTLASLAFAEVLRLVAIYWTGLTGGSVGINIPFEPGWQNLTFQSNVPFYYISLAFAAVSVGIAYMIYKRAFGYHLRAAASDEEAAQALGINTTRAHVVALLWSAGIAGMLGAFYAFYLYTIEPNTFFSLQLFSLQPALNGIIGGMGTIWGPVVGSALMTPLAEFLRIYLGTVQQGLNFLIYGLILILIVQTIPGGIVSVLSRLFRRLGFRSEDETPPKGGNDQ